MKKFLQILLLILSFDSCKPSELDVTSIDSMSIEQLHLHLAKVSDAGVKAKLLSRKAAILMNERGLNNLQAADIFFNKAYQLAQESEQHFLLSKIAVNRVVNKMQMGDTLRFLHTMDSLLQDTIHDTPFLKYYKHVNLGDYYYDVNNLSKAKEHYLKGLTALPTDTCNQYRDILHAYLAEVYLAQKDTKSASDMIQQLHMYKNCPAVDTSQVMYYINDIKYQHLSLLYWQGIDVDQADMLSLLYNRRRYATKMFVNEDDTHLGDLYDQNTHRVLDAYHKLYGSEIPMSENERLLDLLHHNSSNKIKREKLRNLSKRQKEKQQEINRLLKEVNDFKNDFGYDDPAYKRLYELLVVEAENFSNIAVPLGPRQVDQKLNYSIFSSYANYLWRVDIIGEKLTLNKLDQQRIQSLKEKFQLDLLGKKDMSIIKKKLSDKLFSDADNIGFIVPEKNTITLPLQYLYGDHVDIDYSLLAHRENSLSSTKSVVFSYSDEESLKETKDLEYIELASGLKESEAISNILNSPNLLKDEKFNEDAIIKNSNNDIMHFSTHGVVNTKIRQDCYLVVNDRNGRPQKFYGYDIIKMDEAPTFVNLSACDTGLGFQLDGNGTYSLSREFIRNGSKAVIKTLWKVDDKATYIFQTKLYEFWTEGCSLGEAIFDAQKYLKIHKSYSHPYYWAGFVLEGNPNLYLK